MEYTIRQLADLAGVTTRTLRWYHEIGLLEPARMGANGYRYYGPAQVDRLQHILFYRALGVELPQIKACLDDPAFCRLDALRDHLRQLRREQDRIQRLIQAVSETITREERKEAMSAQEKFKVFQEEARQRWGDEAVDASQAKLAALRPEEQLRWKELETEILTRLNSAVSRGLDPSGEEGRAIARLHREWLCFSWTKYTPQAHRGLAQMYTADPRFTACYDRDQEGCAAFLKAAIEAEI